MSAVCLPMAWRGLNAGSCTPLPRLVCPQPRLSGRQLRECRFYQAGRLDRPRRPPSVQSPFAQLGCYLHWGDVIRLLRGHYSSVFARTGSCAAPVGSLLLRLLASFGESLQVVTSPCCPRQLPDVISNSLSLDAGSPTPAVHRVLAPVSSTVSSAFPTGKWVGFPHLSRLKRLRARGEFRGCRYFVMFRPPSLLAPQIVPTAANTPAGQPGLLRPSRTRFVTSPRIGYANRPTTGNWRYGDLHPARLRPCRLLLSSSSSRTVSKSVCTMSWQLRGLCGRAMFLLSRLTGCAARRAAGTRYRTHSGHMTT